MSITSINAIPNALLLLLSMAFFTLLEHKMLAYSQHRKGPNKITMEAWALPGADALKLITKEKVAPLKFNTSIFILSSTMTLTLAITLWIIYPSSAPFLMFNFSIIFFLMISSCGVYPIILMGWSSNSKYSLLGALRSVAQTVSYEISLVLILLNLLLISKSWDLSNLTDKGWGGTTIILMLPILLMWLTTTLAETNRAPFDFAESESELVSGFNTEYGSVLFVLIFMAEYLNIMFLAMLTSVLMISPSNPHFALSALLTFMVLFMSSLTIILRSTYPRLRYDRLMALTWMSFLPLSIILLGATQSLKT